jgi:chromosome segregation ATPase
MSSDDDDHVDDHVIDAMNTFNDTVKTLLLKARQEWEEQQEMVKREEENELKKVLLSHRLDKDNDQTTIRELTGEVEHNQTTIRELTGEVEHLKGLLENVTKERGQLEDILTQKLGEQTKLTYENEKNIKTITELERELKTVYGQQSELVDMVDAHQKREELFQSKVKEYQQIMREHQDTLIANRQQILALLPIVTNKKSTPVVPPIPSRYTPTSSSSNSSKGKI